MVKLFAYEIQKLRHSAWVFLLTLAMTIMVFYINGAFNYKTHSALLALETQRLEEAPNQTYEQWFGVDTDDFDDVVEYHREYAFTHTLYDPSAISYVSILLGAVFFGIKFSNREFSVLVSSGFSRWKIITSSLALYYIFAGIVSFLGLVMIYNVYSPGWMQKEHISTIIFLHVLLDLGSVGFSVLFSMLFQDIIRPIIASFITVLLLGLLQTNTSLLSWLPFSLQSNRFLWVELASSQLFWQAIVSSFCMIALTVGLSIFIFYKKDLE